MNLFTYVVVPLLMAAYLAYYYWKRARGIKAAGGESQYFQEQLRATFRLPAAERVAAGPFVGAFYLGGLRPDVGPGLAAKVGAAVMGISYSGAPLQAVVTERGVLCVARLDETGTTADFHCQPGRFRILSAAEAFPGSPHLGDATKGHRVKSLNGATGNQELIHIVDPAVSGAGITLWVDPYGAECLRQAARGQVPRMYG